MRLLWVALTIIISTGCMTNADYQERLYTPTHITKLDNKYFVIDCWNHRIIYSENLHAPIKEWLTLDDEIAGPHSIDSDGTLYVTEDTGRNSILVYKEKGDVFEKIQTIKNVGERPHRTRYDADTDTFYVVTGNSQEVFAYKPSEDGLILKYSKKLTYLDDTYVRSFTIIDGKMYFVSGVGVNKGKITEVNYLDGSYSIVNQYGVPEGHENGTEIVKIGDYYYVNDITGVIRVKNLNDLESNNFEIMNKELDIKGYPYYMSEFDGRTWITEIYPYSQIKSFVIKDGNIENVEVLIDAGKPTKANEKRKEQYPL